MLARFFSSRFHLLCWLAILCSWAIVGAAGDRDLADGICIGFGLGWLAFVD
jgi:uncharacterized membrane-anchored protein